ncbi:pentatricopeptide repeat-containing protein at5g46580 chloroplastic [Phtheirospermum japonicum]|uniref:Pentatricopeptide repeat-containing protein at5g46580 chloroplastic n=1 Tax=Phtheirospermum japonicum TaxID=374723 RepID=A0A830BBU8_9LAMI|nr:pentatricopeptide repeat-containing protein at5g46580 chloroplastic [Phtheirospermum japonicum]
MATNLSTALVPYHHHHSDTTHHRPLHFTIPFRLPTNKKRLAILRNSSKKAPPPPPPPAVAGEQTSPSLADQLKPLSTTILSDQPNEAHLLSKPKSTWVNPTKPKPSVLSLQRHKRSSSYSYNPQIKDLRQFAKKLNDCDESDFPSVIESIPHPPTRENALLVLNTLRPWQKSLLFFNWVKAQNVFPIETIFYNVTMKSLRFGRQFHHIETLAFEMIENGIELDNITYSTIITCAKRCNLFDKAVEWFERMYKTGLMPDEVTYSAVLDVYAKLGKVEEVMSLYERGRASGWKPDSIAFAVLAKMFGEAGDYDGIRYVLQEMKSIGIEPNLVVYNTLLEAMGKAGKPGLARSLFEEMVGSGIVPNEKTLTALIKIYGRARWARDALELWERMRVNGWPVDFILYNTLLSMCADLGLVDEAERLFEDMKGSEKRKPDSWSYTAMLNIYGSSGDVEKAMFLFEEMMEKGVGLNVMGCTCLIQCLGRAKRIDDLVRVFETAVRGGVKPDDRLCGCLLSVVSYCEGDNAIKVLSCLEQANPKLVAFVRILCGGENVNFEDLKEEFKRVLSNTDVEARRPFCNCLIDICRNRGFDERAHELLYLGTVYGLYPGLHTKTEEEWRLNVRSLSVGAAHTAFEEWMGTLAKIVHRRESLPALFSANTGAGTHKFSQGLGSAFATHVEKLAAPFRESEGKSGFFVATREELVSWVESRAPSVMT